MRIRSRIGVPGRNSRSDPRILPEAPNTPYPTLTTTPVPQPELKRVLSLRDVVLFYVVAIVGPRWIASAAAAGPSSLVIWALACLGMFIPSAFCVLELSNRYPEEG